MLFSINLFRGYSRYFKIFQEYIGKKLFILLGLALVAAVAESIGIMMLLPLLKVLEVGKSLGDKAEMLLSLMKGLGFPATQTWVLVFIGLVFICKGLILIVQKSYRGFLETSLMQTLRSRLLSLYNRMDHVYYISRNTGHFINIINLQIDQFMKSFTTYIQVNVQVIMALIYLVFAAFLNWIFTFMAVGGGIIILLVFRLLSEFARKISKQMGLENSYLNKLLVQILQALKYLKSTASTDQLEANAFESIRKVARSQFKLKVALAFTKSAKEPIAVLFMISIMFLQITILNQPLAPIIVALILFYRALNTILSLQQNWQSMMNTVGGLEITMEELEEAAKHQERSGTEKVGTFSRVISFEDVNFAYDKRNVLENISLQIPINKTVAIVGESGAGKSTLVDLMTLLLRPDSGKVFIDGISGNKVDLWDWRGNIGFVTQETVVFDDSIANNISLWSCKYNRDESCRKRVLEASRKAYCHPFIEEMPEGYQTVVGDRGVKLSGGQKQRLFIARELFKKPRLLILDEATSSLDTESERYIQKSIDGLKGKMTVVIIAHRLSTIKNVDYIYVLDKGKIIEQGTFDELSTNNDTKFSKMVAMQNI